MATLEDFKAVFGPLFILAGRKDMQGQTTQEKEGYISKIIPSKRNPNWKGFVFQGSDEMYSITLNEKVPPDLTEVIQSIQPNSHVTFYYTSNQGQDGKVYNNIAGVELLQNVHDDQDPAESGNGGHRVAGALTNRDKVEIMRIAGNNATANAKEGEKPTDPKQWAVWYSTIRKTLEEDWWKF